MGLGMDDEVEVLVEVDWGATPAPDKENGPKIVPPRGPSRRVAFDGGPDGPAGGVDPGPVPSPAASFCPTFPSQNAPRSWGHLTVGCCSPHFEQVCEKAQSLT